VFRKVLIANRGAIAVRIARTLRRMGIASAAVYTKADRDSLHVEAADEAVLIGEGPAKDSYLDAGRILDVAERVGADAVHPGYGFLSENAAFARACRERNIAFIGPDPEHIDMFGLKHAARAFARQAGVPLLPGTPPVSEIEAAVRSAAEIGYPIMLKSAAGGGGIGMRVCWHEAELREAFGSVRALAETYFGDGSVFLEKYIPYARHVEVQIFGNRFGEAAAIGERDCSVQRRNQKVIEETPAPHLPPRVRTDMWEAARRLARLAKYRSAGTVEFLYDPETERFYFLEVNTRLQVEHGVTEEVYGIDLVEWMVREAADDLRGLESRIGSPNGHSIQARLYAEDPFAGFRPSAGRIDAVRFPAGVRVETWIRDGAEVSTLYDPMLAKIIVCGDDRDDAVRKLAAALDETRVYGVTTNLPFLQELLARPDFRQGRVHTKMLEGFCPDEAAIEVVDGGVQTTVQDWPGRIGYWDVGVPPSGPMDALSFRIGNRLLGNPDSAPGLELTLRGGTYRFRGDVRFCLTGADMDAKLDGRPVPMYAPVSAGRWQTLEFGEARAGMRTYLLVEGGFDVPQVLGSSSTFTLGGFGGHGGRALRAGDVLRVRGSAACGRPGGRADGGAGGGAGGGSGGVEMNGAADGRFAKAGNAPRDAELPVELRPAIGREWTIGVLPGPHCTAEFLQGTYLRQLAETRWQVHFNSSRTGVRLVGPSPAWAREDGGDAGLHPSNIHDNAYAVGALDLTGDMPILLGPDGPSLGGFVCPATTAAAERWKLGQLRPGDTVVFRLLTLEEAEQLRKSLERFLDAVSDAVSGTSGGSAEGKSLSPDPLQAMFVRKTPQESPPVRLPDPEYPVLAREAEGRRFPITVRASGDEYVLVEYGGLELDLRYRFQVHALMEAIRESGVLPYINLTPGIRSLQVQFDPDRMSSRDVCAKILELDRALPPLESMRVRSRVVRLPLSWDDPAVRLAVERYCRNIRPDAPWCPDNLEFIRRINGLDRVEDVRYIVFSAEYLVLGLGDVYLGAPVAVPLDPRHRLVTTKYNPARTWTPENAVGIGGAYLCIYGMEGPGGYQLVGRTVQVWNTFQKIPVFEPGKPWLLRFFDRIRFYPVDAGELAQIREEFPRGRFSIEVEEAEFDLGEYFGFLKRIADEAAAFRARQQAAFAEERRRWKESGLAEYRSEVEAAVFAAESGEEAALPPGASAVRSQISGSVWKILVEPGRAVRRGDPLVALESMKMEFIQQAPCDGTVVSVHVRQGETVPAGRVLVGLIPAQFGGGE